MTLGRQFHHCPPVGLKHDDTTAIWGGGALDVKMLYGRNGLHSFHDEGQIMSTEVEQKKMVPPYELLAHSASTLPYGALEKFRHFRPWGHRLRHTFQKFQPLRIALPSIFLEARQYQQS